jgi:hypothetical protein
MKKANEADYEIAVAQALWLEERYFATWAEMLKKLLGVK